MTSAVPDTPNGHIAEFAAQVLAWFDRSGRKHLPWQRDPTPYRVWVSEIMLQQTQVTTVIPYYERFMQRFPTAQALAAAPIDEVLHLWTGLGYYARARNLHRAALRIVSEHAGVFPDELDTVQSLPGIGRSTAGAILALSMSQRHPILDGNVKRVLTRCFGIEGFPGHPAIERKLWTIADACTPADRVASYTQAMMDLGATVCVRSRPSCLTCPLSERCIARKENRQMALPTPRPRKVRPQRSACVVIAVRADGCTLLEQRPPAGIWGGLWTFPQFDDHEAATRWISEQLRGEAIDRLPPYQHSFTHFDLTLHPLLVRDARRPDAIADHDGHCWYDLARPARIGLAKPAIDLIHALHSPPAIGGQTSLL
jgi:A/G-specific adenine glycosylase